ncbi:MAG: signal peptide peptidase SppA [Symbiobacterium sp.]|uniref:signal peptide peptidase SppA n=1 Tax=Symbiobacterium sp. TaxID=1971213 RepID=UPI003463F1BE
MKRWVAGIALITVVVLSLAVALWQGPNAGERTSRAAGGEIALLRVEGVMETGESSGGLLGGYAGSDDIVAQLDEVAEDPTLKAVVMRVNSPGGSLVAAWEISEAIKRVQAAGKPVVVSMGETAASAAYWISAAADWIIANPATQTGSIGVILQVQNLAGIYEKLGYELETFKSGTYKDIGNPAREMTDDERALLQELVDEAFADFVQAVAEGRGMDPEQVRAIADGRILTGRKALELGLVDELGDLKRSVEVAGELAGIEGEPSVREMNKGNSLFGALLGKALTEVVGRSPSGGLWALETKPAILQ